MISDPDRSTLTIGAVPTGSGALKTSAAWSAPSSPGKHVLHRNTVVTIKLFTNQVC